MQLRHFAPAALIVASSACFATRNDVRILQEDIHSLRALQIRADSARTRQLADMSVSLNNTLGSVKDSVRDLGVRLTTFQGATRQEFYSMGQQLLQLGERLGQSQAAMQNFRADLEERNRQFVEQAVRSTVPPPAPGDTTKVAAPPTRLTEGPNVLYQIGRDQLMNNSWSAARDAFNQLLTQHPTSDRVPEAMAGIADSYDAEGNFTQGDSVYRAVVAKYPSTKVAPTALYKLGLSLERQKKRAEARTTMQQVVRNYPGTDESTLATEWLANKPPPS
jgi:tol-pal system protein YbgF